MRPTYISYRPQHRDLVERIRRRILLREGYHMVMMNTERSKPDRESIEAHVEMMMSGCRRVFFVIGEEWAGLDEYGRFRLSSADVPIYAELRAAFTLKLEAILILVDDAELPPRQQIPEAFQGLLAWPVVRVHQDTLNQDMRELVPAPAFKDLLRLLFPGWRMGR